MKSFPQYFPNILIPANALLIAKKNYHVDKCLIKIKAISKNLNFLFWYEMQLLSYCIQSVMTYN